MISPNITLKLILTVAKIILLKIYIMKIIFKEILKALYVFKLFTQEQKVAILYIILKAFFF